MINEEDDIVKQIKKAFGINPENTNFSSVESAPMDPNYFNFQTPAEFAPIQTGQQKNDFSQFPDDKFLFGFTIKHVLDDDVERYKFAQHLEDLKQQDPSIDKDYDKMNLVLQDYLQNNNKISFRPEQIPRLRLVDSLTDKKAKQIYDKMSDVDKKNLDLYLDDTLKANHTLKRDDEFKKIIKEELINKIEEEDEFDDIFKEDEEALLGMKVPEKISTGLNLTHYDSDDDDDEIESGSSITDAPSPVHKGSSTMSAKTTAPYGTETASSVGEITSVEEAKRKPMPKGRVGRPATRKETKARIAYENEVKNFKLTKKVNAGKTFDFNQPQRMEYNIEFYNSFNY
jgi:hypothetical protein